MILIERICSYIIQNSLLLREKVQIKIPHFPFLSKYYEVDLTVRLIKKGILIWTFYSTIPSVGNEFWISGVARGSNFAACTRSVTPRAESLLFTGIAAENISPLRSAFTALRMTDNLSFAEKNE